MIQSAQYSINSTPVQIVADSVATEEVHIHCAGTVYIGGSDVTTSNGLKLDNGDKITLLNHIGSLWAVSSAGNQSMSVLVIEK